MMAGKDAGLVGGGVSAGASEGLNCSGPPEYRL